MLTQKVFDTQRNNAYAYRNTDIYTCTCTHSGPTSRWQVCCRRRAASPRHYVLCNYQNIAVRYSSP